MPRDEPDTQFDAQDYMQGMDLPSILETQKNAEISKWEINTQELIDDFFHTLRAEEYNEKTGKWKTIAGARPLMNEYGARRMVSIISPIINRNTLLSNLKEERINSIMLFLSFSVIDDICKNYEYYGIVMSDIRITIEIVQDVVEMAMRRAMNEGERNYRKTFQRFIQTLKGDNEEKSGLGKMFSGVGL